MAWVPVILVTLGLAVVAYVILLWHERGLPTLGPRRERPPKGPRGGGGGGSGRRRPTGNASEVNMSMEEWLAKQAAGQGED